MVIATKFGISSHEGNEITVDSSPLSIRKAVEGSLKRLNTDHIDLYYQHRIDPAVNPETVANTMQELIDEGKITHWGISEANEEYLRRANAVCKLTAVQNRYSMMYRKYEDLFPVLEELNVGLVAFSPLANGLLSGKIHQSSFGESDLRNNMPQFTNNAYRKNQALLKLLQELAEQHHATVAQISLAWMINKKSYIVPIPGSRHLNRMEDNMKAAQIKMSSQEIKQIDQTLSEIPMSDVFGGTTIKNK